MVQKAWVKGNRMRLEMTVEGQTALVYIVDRDAKTMYMYSPAVNAAMKMNLYPGPAPMITQLASIILSRSATEWVKSLLATNPVVVGTETIDGKPCLVVEFTSEQRKGKMWVWEEYGLPVRMELPIPGTPGGTMILEWKNIEFVDIPDSMFQLPPGVQVQEQK